jgi:hypothetical protein
VALVVTLVVTLVVYPRYRAWLLVLWSIQWLESQRQEYFRLFGVDLTQVDGIAMGTLQTLAAEVGPDLSRFRSAAAFTRWAGLTPKQEISGGKLLCSKTPKNKNRVAYALRMAAQSLLHRRSAMGDVSAVANKVRDAESHYGNGAPARLHHLPPDHAPDGV